MTEQTLSMYKDMHKWEDVVRVADAKGHPQADKIKRDYHAMLLSSGQEERLGMLLKLMCQCLYSRNQRC